MGINLNTKLAIFDHVMLHITTSPKMEDLFMNYLHPSYPRPSHSPDSSTEYSVEH